MRKRAEKFRIEKRPSLPEKKQNHEKLEKKKENDWASTYISNGAMAKKWSAIIESKDSQTGGVVKAAIQQIIDNKSASHVHKKTDT